MDVQRIVINTCFGGFELSEQALRVINRDELEMETERDNPLLVMAVEYLGEAANGPHAKLKVVDVPDGVAWTIQNYDGVEWVAENHCTWR